MSGKTGIAWTDATWNPVVGCTRVSAGCDHCYAFQLHDQRYVAWRRGHWPTAPEQYRQPFSNVRLLPARLDDPLHWRRPRRVFVNSMSDLFHPDVPDEFICRIFEAMLFAEKHTFQILTKRAERMRQFITEIWPRWAKIYATPVLPNVWLGVSVEHQAAADERIPLLLQTPAAVRFLSCEPLLGPVDLCDVRYDNMVAINTLTGEYGFPRPYGGSGPRIHWCIIGGESGPHARPMEVEWARSLVEQCREADVPVFMKQLGTVNARIFNMHDRHGGDIEEWRERHLLPRLDVREFPQTTTAVEVARS